MAVTWNNTVKRFMDDTIPNQPAAPSQPPIISPANQTVQQNSMQANNLLRSQQREDQLTTNTRAYQDKVRGQQENYQQQTQQTQWDRDDAVRKRKLEAGGAVGTNLGNMINALSGTTGLNLLDTASGSSGGGGGGGGNTNTSQTATLPPFIPYVPTPGNFPQVQLGDTTAANAAVFARGKDQAAQTAQSAVTGLRSALGGRGMLGSGAEARATAGVANNARQGINEITREQSIQDATNLQDRNNLNYQGGISQRGQDITNAGNVNNAHLTARGQDIGMLIEQGRREDEQKEAQRRAQQQSLQGLLGIIGSTGDLLF